MFATVTTGVTKFVTDLGTDIKAEFVGTKSYLLVGSYTFLFGLCIGLFVR